jgi:hypothetical protein
MRSALFSTRLTHLQYYLTYVMQALKKKKLKLPAVNSNFTGDTYDNRKVKTK